MFYKVNTVTGITWLQGCLPPLQGDAASLPASSQPRPQGQLHRRGPGRGHPLHRHRPPGQPGDNQPQDPAKVRHQEDDRMLRRFCRTSVRHTSDNAAVTGNGKIPSKIFASPENFKLSVRSLSQSSRSVISSSPEFMRIKDILDSPDVSLQRHKKSVSHLRLRIESVPFIKCSEKSLWVIHAKWKSIEIILPFPIPSRRLKVSAEVEASLC